MAPTPFPTLAPFLSAYSRIYTLRLLLIQEAVGAVRDHVRVHEGRYASQIVIGDCVASSPQLSHNFL